MTDLPPDPDVRTYDQLINQDFRGGQAHILKLRNFIRSTFYSGGLGAMGSANEISIKEFPGYDPSGTAPGTNHLAISAAWNKMKELGRSRVVLPPGNYRLGEALSLTKPWVDGRRCELVGSGRYTTQIIGPASSTNIINFGDITASESGNMGFRGFSLVPGAVQTGYAMAFEHCRDVYVSDVHLHLPAKGFGLGMSAPTSAHQVEEIFFDNICGSLKSGADAAFFDLGCAQQVHINGGRTTGRSNQRFINQVGSVSNTDGLYVRDIFSELWGYGIYSTGLGIVNFAVDVKQFDRATTFVHFAGTGSYRHGQIKGQFLSESVDADETTPAFLFSAAAAGCSIGAITVHNSIIAGRSGPAFKFVGDAAAATRKPAVLVQGNFMESCGIGGGGVPVCEIDANSNPNFFGNQIYMGLLDGAEDPYTYAFNFAGSSTGRRGTEADLIANNTILDFATGEVNGTP